MALEPSMCAEAQTNAYGAVDFYVAVTLGVAVVSTYFGGCMVTVARNSAGNYTITLPKVYRTLLMFEGGMQQASGATLQPTLVSETLNTDGKLIVETRVAAGTATEPATGNKMFLKFTVSSDYLNDKFQV